MAAPKLGSSCQSSRRLTTEFITTCGSLGIRAASSDRGRPAARMARTSSMPVRIPSPVVARSRKMMCPDCSPPRTASSRSIASNTWRSPTGVRTIRAPGGADGPLEAAVAHDGHHQQAVAQRAVRQPGERADAHDGVTVHQLPALVDGDQPIGVAVEREPEVQPGGSHRLRQALGMGRPAAGVDVRAVRRVEQDGDIGSERAEQLRARGWLAEPLAQSIPIAQPGERVARDLGQVAFVGGDGPSVRPRPPELGVAPVRDRRRVVEQRLELVLLGRAGLAAGDDDLEPVVGGRVVRRRDHDGRRSGLAGARAPGTASSPRRGPPRRCRRP